MNLDIKSRLIRQRVITESGCWEWQGTRTTTGYGRIHYNGKLWLVHRVASRLWLPDFTEDKITRHKCDNPSCFNPEHLRNGTHGQNSLDSILKGRNTSYWGNRKLCKRGHLLEGNNLVKSGNHRICKKCANLRQFLYDHL